MKCPKCGSENKSTAKFCNHCGGSLTVVPAGRAARGGSGPQPLPPPPTQPLWKPDWRWHLKTLAAIYIFLAIFYLVVDRFLSKVPEPFRMRDIPKEMTPWLKR